MTPFAEFRRRAEARQGVTVDWSATGMERRLARGVPFAGHAIRMRKCP